jgi:hypothetical protein
MRDGVGTGLAEFPADLEKHMRRILMAVAMSSMTVLVATSPASCSQQLMSVLALLCPDCYQHYLSTTGK